MSKLKKEPFLTCLDTNHKGTWCWIDKRRFCQEGWCIRCAVYQDYRRLEAVLNGSLSAALVLAITIKKEVLRERRC